ncbi:hypothetical protein llap_20139 [Limosa lapponica baueri]|uniref:RNase H type-1 domain-containing protein n=1 Tax=Limosa lapponica baueri TaxID=1758121 RepID=A0A2I0T6Z2_LIMLA|nr:hypothetical protein llap_20139 [Limosa lapponica baueri]
MGNPSHPGILEVIMDWPEGKDFEMSLEEEVMRAEEAPPYNELPENEKRYALFTDGSCRMVGKHRKRKAAVWSPARRVAEVTEGQGKSSQFAEVKAIQLALDIAEREKWLVLYLYTNSWMVANALWGWLQQWKQSNWQRKVLLELPESLAITGGYAQQYRATQLHLHWGSLLGIQLRAHGQWALLCCGVELNNSSPFGPSGPAWNRLQ